MTFKVGDVLEYKWFYEGTVKVLAVDNARIVIEFPDGSFDLLKSSDFDQLSYPKPKPKFEVGDKVKTAWSKDPRIVLGVYGDQVWVLNNSNNLPCTEFEDTLTLWEEEKLPFPRVGAWIHRRDHDDQYHRRITHVDGDCVRYELVNRSGQPTRGAYFALLSSGQVTEVENPFED